MRSSYNKVCLILLSLCAVTLAKSIVMIEKAKVVKANSKYFASAVLKVHENDEGTYSLDGDYELIQNIPNNTIVVGNIYAYVDMKYELAANTLGKHLCKFLNDEFSDWLTNDYLSSQNMVYECPILKGTYWFRNFTPQEISYPVTTLWNKSLSELFFYYGEELLLHVKWYATLVKY